MNKVVPNSFKPPPPRPPTASCINGGIEESSSVGLNYLDLLGGGGLRYRGESHVPFGSVYTVVQCGWEVQVGLATKAPPPLWGFILPRMNTCGENEWKVRFSK